MDLLNDDFHRNAREVLRFWISVDLDNLQRVKAGIHSFKMPDCYHTNRTAPRARVIQGIAKAENIDRALEHLKESLAWISSQLHRGGDMSRAVRCALLLRHFFRNDLSGTTHDAVLHQAINKLVGKKEEYLFVGVDELNALIDQRLTKGSNEGSYNPNAG